MKQNITLSFDHSLLRKIKAFAAAKGESISGLIREHFTMMLQEKDEYTAKKKKALANMKKGLSLGGGSYYSDRAELHER